MEPAPNESTDVWQMSCLGGWTAGNVVAPVGAMAAWTEALFGPGEQIVSSSMQQVMRDTRSATMYGFYGIAAFNLSKAASDLPWPDGEAWGHLGSTYGYQSITAFFPATNVTVVVASNLEIRQQDQPSDSLCSAYAYTRNYLMGRPFPRCRFEKSGYFMGRCNCSSQGDSWSASLNAT